MTKTVTLPIRTVNEANGSHGNWRPKAARRKKQRMDAYIGCPRMLLPCVVTLTRISAGTLDDDNLRVALKSVRDGIADRFGIKDNDPRISWLYAQRRGKPKQYAVEIEIQELDEANKAA